MIICLEQGENDLHMGQLMPCHWFNLSGAGLSRLSWKRDIKQVSVCHCVRKHFPFLFLFFSATTPHNKNPELPDQSEPCCSKISFAQHLLEKPGIERVQALADISRLALCCHSNKTHAPTANLPNSAQLEGTPYHSPNLHTGPCSSVGMRQWTHRQADTQTAVTNIHFASATPHVKCNNTANTKTDVTPAILSRVKVA